MSSASSASLDEAQAALRFIPSGDRGTWIRVGMALKSGFGEAGFELFDTWSQSASNYKAKDARAAWRSFRPGKVTLGTLWFIAQQHGWQRPHRDQQRREDPDALRRAREQRREQERIERRKLREEADAAAARVLKLMPTCEIKPHPYLEAKGFPEHVGIVAPDGRLVLPVFNAQGKVRSAQYITADGTKKFEWRGQIGGNFHCIGNLQRATEAWLCEGYATGLSVKMALQKRSLGAAAVIVCFSAQNLQRVGTKLKQKFDKIFAVADHDLWRCPNKHTWSGADYERICQTCGAVGVPPAGASAAEAVGIPYWQPPVPKSDANDFMQAKGLDALASALRDFRFGKLRGRT